VSMLGVVSILTRHPRRRPAGCQTLMAWSRGGCTGLRTRGGSAEGGGLGGGSRGYRGRRGSGKDNVGAVNGKE